MVGGKAVGHDLGGVVGVDGAKRGVVDVAELDRHRD